MKKLQTFKIFWTYIKEDKLKLFLYMLLVALTYIPALLAVTFWGIAIEALSNLDFNKFIIFLIINQATYIFLYTFLQIPRDSLYQQLEIRFNKSVSKDLYQKIDKMPAIAFEDMGVGEFINRLYTDPDRIMELLSKMIRLMCKSVVVVIVLVFSFKISILLGMEVLFLAVIMCFISTKFFPKIKKNHEKIKKESDEYVKVATENITGIREIKSLGIKQNIERNVFGVIDKLYKNISRVKKYERWYYALNNLAYFIIQFIIFLTCGKYFVEGKIPLSIFLMMESYIWRVDEVVESISDFGVSYNKVTVSLKRIGEILNNKLYEDEKYGDIDLENPKGIIEFKKVKFYKRRVKTVTTVSSFHY